MNIMQFLIGMGVILILLTLIKNIIEDNIKSDKYFSNFRLQFKTKMLFGEYYVFGIINIRTIGLFSETFEENIEVFMRCKNNNEYGIWRYVDSGIIVLPTHRISKLYNDYKEKNNV